MKLSDLNECGSWVRYDGKDRSIFVDPESNWDRQKLVPVSKEMKKNSKKVGMVKKRKKNSIGKKPILYASETRPSDHMIG